MIVLWQFEQCPYCKKVREALTELRGDYICVNAPQGDDDHDTVMEKLFGSVKVPALWDTQTGTLIRDTDQCLEYVREEFGAEGSRSEGET